MTSARFGAAISRVVVAGCAALSIAAAVAATSASADSFTWVGPQSLMAAGGTGAVPTVSCPTVSQCTTVDGRGDEITFNPNPTPPSSPILSRAAVDVIGTVASVSCPSTSQCTAVDNGGNEITFDPATGAVNSGGRNDIDSNLHLTAVSCLSGTNCTAVDNHGQETTFDPSSGTVLGGQPKTIDGTVALTGLSCSASQCVAVDSQGDEVTFAPTATPGASVNSVDGSTPLTSVSCSPDDSVCAAVDGSGNEISFTPSTGTANAPSQIDTNSGNGVPLNAVSCPSASQCVAVDSQGDEVTFAPTATPAPSVNSVDGSTYLTAVSCPAGSSSCVAVDKPSGNAARELEFSTSGAAGQRNALLAPVLDGVSCPLRTQCTSIASGSQEATFDPTTGAVNGAGVVAVDTSGNLLTAIACLSATECTAVDSGGNEVTFNPATGNVIANSFFPVDPGGALRSVACVVASGTPQCTAVDTRGSEVTFNPETSTAPQGVIPLYVSGIPPVLDSVSCPMSTQCTVVDNQGNEVTFNPVTGQNYVTQQIITVDSGQVLESVSCPSADQCTAVDHTGGVVTFLDPASTPQPLGRQQIENGSISLNSVSCPAANQCTAVDDLGQEATFDPSSTTLGPSLLMPAAGNPQGNALLQANKLEAVACQSTIICAAVDAEGNDFAGVVPPADSTLPTISGTPQQSHQLSETNGSWANFPTGFTYVWEDCTSATDTSKCTPITGASAQAYTPAPTDVGQYIRVQETASNAGGPGQPVFSAATALIRPAPATNSAPPRVTSASSLYQQGQPLAAQRGTWNETAGGVPTYPGLTYHYQWQDCSAAGTHCSNIAGATASTYTPAASDVGHTLRVEETADNGGLPVPSLVPSTVTPVIEPAPPVNTAPPTIGGRAQEGQVLTEGHGGWTNNPTAYAYQWELCDASGANCAPIAGATGATYTPNAGDVGHTLVVKESVANGGQPQPAAVSSAPTPAVVPAAPSAISPPTIAGAVAQGRTLTEGHGLWNGGVDVPTGFSYQWEHCSVSGANCVPIAGATGATYTPATGDVGHSILVLERASNAGGSTTSASVPTAITAPAPAPAVEAYTQGASRIKATSSTVRARLTTLGLGVTWQFVYGTTTRYRFSSGTRTIPAGGAAPVTVSQVLVNLKPKTTYHYRVVESVAGGPYSTPTTVYGEDLTFTTGPGGKIALGHSRLGVSRSGVVSVPLDCASTASCSGRFSISAKASVGGHLASVLCNTHLTQVPAGRRRNIAVKLTRSCLALVQGAGRKGMAGTFTMRPRSVQKGLIESITLVPATSKKAARRHGTRTG